MMNCSYDELYLPLAQRMMGDMFDFAVHSLGYKIGDFFDLFVVSGMAKQVEKCNPTYVAGMNGCEVAKCVVEMCTNAYPEIEDVMYVDKSEEYWIGWILAYYQWVSCRSFESIIERASFDDLYFMYPTFHEADVTLFVEAMDQKYVDDRQDHLLKRLRAYAKLSQSQLAKQSGVPLRQIQLFEQGHRDIKKTQAQTLNALAKVLNCDMELFFEE